MLKKMDQQPMIYIPHHTTIARDGSAGPSNPFVFLK